MSYRLRLERIERALNPTGYISPERKKELDELAKRIVITDDELTPEQIGEGKIRITNDEFRNMLEEAKRR